MSKQLIRHVWCDVHEKDQDQQVPGESYTLSLNGAAVEVDLCAEHAAPLVELGSWLERYGEPADRAPVAVNRAADGRPKRGRPALKLAADGACPACDFTSVRGKQGVHQHFSRRHGQTLTEWAREHAPEAVPGGHSRPLNQAPMPCPECGRVLQGPQALGSHRGRAHGYRRPRDADGRVIPPGR